MKCLDCGWEGELNELINPDGNGDGRHVDGECCPNCESENVEEL